ncbi:tyrosine-type recombinase/integrase [Patescibacteria group bacterium]|nr:tyrosine-type recombinase/integrase [Patescibacteria group bacterium]
MKLTNLDDFLLNLKANNYSEETIYSYERDLNVFDDFLEDIKADFNLIDKKTILNYKAYLISQDRLTAKSEKTAKKLSPFSINRMLSAARSYFKFLIDMDFKSPVSPSSIALVKTVQKHPRVSEFAEIVALIESPETLEKNRFVAKRNRAMLEVLFSTGMRISELLSLRKEQIDKTGRVFIRGKGKKERFAYLTPRALKHIKGYSDLLGLNDSAFLFIPLRGKNAHNKDKRISANYLQERVKRYRELLGINIPLSCHSIRHAFATYLAESGANPAAIQILLGHESLDTTTRYVHASDRYAEKMHNKYHPLRE